MVRAHLKKLHATVLRNEDYFKLACGICGLSFLYLGSLQSAAWSGAAYLAVEGLRLLEVNSVDTNEDHKKLIKEFGNQVKTHKFSF